MGNHWIGSWLYCYPMATWHSETHTQACVMRARKNKFVYECDVMAYVSVRARGGTEHVDSGNVASVFWFFRCTHTPPSQSHTNITCVLRVRVSVCMCLFIWMFVLVWPVSDWLTDLLSIYVNVSERHTYITYMEYKRSPHNKIIS